MSKGSDLEKTDRKALASRFGPLVIQQLQVLEEELGGRQEIVGMLTLAPLNPDLRYILGLLGDPRYKAKSLAEICALGNILPGELMKHLSQAALLRGRVLAHHKIGAGIAAVVEDVVAKAAPYEGICNGPCQGTGSIVQNPTAENPNPGPEPCPVCRGQGKLIYPAQEDKQKLAIEMAGLLPKGGGLQIVNANVQGGGGGALGGAGLGALEQLQQVTDRILYGDGRPAVDAEIIPEGAPESTGADGAAADS